MLYKHISGSSLGGNVMTQEQSILKEMPLFDEPLDMEKCYEIHIYLE